jgi:hypothetical protein
VTARKHGKDARGLLFTALSGRTGADIGESPRRSLRGQLLAAFGASPRDPDRPNTRSVATGLGVSVRTVNRWLARPDQQHTVPRTETLDRIHKAAQDAARTKPGRTAAVGDARNGPLGKRGMSITIKANQGPSEGDGYSRSRKTVWNLSPDAAQGLFDAYTSQGENGALNYLMNNPELYSMDRWWIGEVESFDIKPRYGF